MKFSIRVFAIAFLLAAILSFALGLLNAYIRVRGGNPMSLLQITAITTPIALIVAVLMQQLKGNRKLNFADGATEKSAKAFRVDAQRAGIYLFRDTFYGKMLGFEIELDQAQLGQTRGKTFFRLDILPGRHVLRSKNLQDDTQIELSLDVNAGELVYIAQDIAMGTKGAKQALTSCSEAEGKKRVMRCRMLMQSTRH